MSAAALTVLTAYFNPAHYETRRRNYRRFARAMRATPGVRLLTIECAFGADPFELARDEAPIQVRAAQPLWIKENLLNRGLARAETDAVAWVDGDVLFQNRAWAEQTVHALRTWPVVQPWSSIHQLGPDDVRLDAGIPSFGRVHRDGYRPPCAAGCCHTGYAWAARRDLLARCGGLVDTLILGGADHLMAAAIFDAGEQLWNRTIAEAYGESASLWCRTFAAAVRRRVGHVEGELHHLYHGTEANRRYGARHALAARHGYEAARHLRMNADGVFEIVGLPAMSAAIRGYFLERQEDEPIAQTPATA